MVVLTKLFLHTRIMSRNCILYPAYNTKMLDSFYQIFKQSKHNRRT